MQLHRHDSLAPGRNIYTLEHINTDFSGNKCGRCPRCFNPSQKQGCKSMDKEYDAGEFVYQFHTDPDERFAGKSRFMLATSSLLALACTKPLPSTGGSDTEHGATYLDSNMPSSSKQAAPSSARMETAPSSSKHAKQRKDVHVSRPTPVRRSAEPEPEQTSAKAVQGIRQEMQRSLERLEKLMENRHAVFEVELRVSALVLWQQT